MITNDLLSFKGDAGVVGDRSLGNVLFKIAGVVGIATKNGYKYGFDWRWQKYFVNPLPQRENKLYKKYKVPTNFAGYDFGFMGFDFPDDRNIDGEFGSEKYFEHCKDLIRYYFEIIPMCEPFKNCILMHYRNYQNASWYALDSTYYKNALKKLPKKDVIVVTDNIEAAFKAIGGNYHYTSNAPITDFYLLAHADYLVMANSTFSWWGAWLSQAMTVVPLKWYAGPLTNAPTKDIYLPNWIKV